MDIEDEAGPSTAAPATVNSTTPWVEKYRPKNVGEVACQEEVVATLTKSIETANLPHLLFYGPPGTGKTSTALAIARQLYGPELFKARVLELNASDERGISIVRTKIKAFASVAVGAPAPGYPSPPYKLLILDEARGGGEGRARCCCARTDAGCTDGQADAMTEDAQNALRRTMELYSRVTRFCFCCNYVSRMIDPIVSRCAKFRFKPLASGAMFSRLEHIAACEALSLAPGCLEALSSCAAGDMRKAITLLQCASRLHGKTVTPSAVEDAAGSVPASAVAALLAAVRPPTGSFEAASAAVYNLSKAGYPALQIMGQLSDAVYADPAVPELAKAALAQRVAIADKCLADGADETLQLLDCAAAAHRALAGLPPTVIAR